MMRMRSKSVNITHKYNVYRGCNIMEVLLFSISMLVIALGLSTIMSSLVFNFPINAGISLMIGLVVEMLALNTLGIKKQHYQPGYLFIRLKAYLNKKIYVHSHGIWTNRS